MLSIFMVLFTLLTASSLYAQCSTNWEKDMKKGLNASDFKSCPLKTLLLIWLRAQEKQSNLTFNELTFFLAHGKNWPSQDVIKKRAENLINVSLSPQQQVQWFKDNPPLSIEGELAYLKALINVNNLNLARTLAKKVWQAFDMPVQKEKEFLRTYGHFLSQEDTVIRINRLIFEQKVSSLPFYSPQNTPFQQGCLFQLNCQKGLGSYDAFRALPKALQDNPFLRLDYLRFLRKHNEDQQAYEILMRSHTDNLTSAEAEVWWKEINILSRRFIEAKNYEKAYKVLTKHKLTAGESFANAEWLKGWLLTEFLTRHDHAAQIFEALFHKVKSPISRSRAAFWVGEASRRIGKSIKSKEWFYKAGHYYGTFYAQMALSRLPIQDQHILNHSALVHPINSLTKKRLLNDPLLKIALMLNNSPYKKYQTHFVKEIAKTLKSSDEQHALLSIVSDMQNQHAVIETAKQIAYKNVILHPIVYPVLPHTWFASQSSHHLAIFHSLIRQESRFKHDVVSTAGAKGLMQLMPETAKLTAKKHKTALGNLFIPKHNVDIGSKHFLDLIEEFNGSIILAVCAYNAGKASVNKWIQQFGYPNEDHLLQWMELIPFYETRNYVQRVLENYFIYQHRFEKKDQKRLQPISLAVFHK